MVQEAFSEKEDFEMAQAVAASEQTHMGTSSGI